MAKIRVLIADDHALLREGIKALLGSFTDIEVVGEACDGREAIEKVKAQPQAGPSGAVGVDK